MRPRPSRPCLPGCAAHGVSARCGSFSAHNPTEVDQYDWGTSAPGPLPRKTLITYASLGGIPNRPSQVEIEDGGGNAVAETTYAYDQTALQATSGLPQHGNPPNSSRGNLTTISQCAAFSGGSCARWLTATLSYFDTGEVYQATAPDGAVTTYTYASSSPGCAGAFPTDVALPKDAQGNSYSLQYFWNCTGGVLGSSTGENGNITSYAYNDPLWRLTGVSDPDGGSQAIDYVSPNETETSTPIASGVAKKQYALLDDLGRPSFSQTVDGTPCDTVQTTYDSATGSVQVSQPYSTACQTPSGGAEFTTTVFDALGRPETVTAPNSAVTSYAYTGPAVTITGPAPGDVSHILQANGLGELAAVCEVTNLTGSGACNTAAGGTGYLTTYSYDALGDLTGVDEAGQTRSFSYDALGRMTAETTPESGATTFMYDTADSSCGNYSSPGSQVERKDDMSPVDVTCYGLDPFGRVTAITYPSGAYASVTPAKTFVYDAATVNGQAMGNAAGRLAEAYTGSASAKITDEGFGYDSMGRPTAFFESTPSSGGYYATQESYYQDGQRDTLTLPWTPVLTYGVNAVGEVTSVGAASGQNPVTAASYNPAGQLLGLTFGSGDSDGYSYTSTTGLMTQYQFTVNGAADTGALNWNADGTLGSLQITDSIPGTNDSQTCSYGYDSLGRIASVSCPNVWSQSFTYDAYGNVKKSGSLNWQPIYNPSSNQANISYDGDGNVTNDGANTYAWDAAGKMITVSSDQATYDALGRLAQESANSSLRFYYAPDGALAGEDNACCGIREQYAGLPGGAEAVFDCCNLYYYRDGDWLGSERLAAWTNQTLVSEEAYAPFGEAYAGAGAGEQMFTGKGQRLAAGIYDFPFRHYSPAQGRWLSPDPAGLAAADPANPQTWNAYAYVANEPLTAADPLGLMVPCGGMFGGPCGGGFGGPGPCDVTGWNPWPAPGCSGGGLGIGIGVSIIGFGGGGGGGGIVVGTPSGPASGTLPPCTAGICSPPSLVGSGGATADQAIPFLGTLWEITVAACGDNPACIGIVLADPEVTVPVLAGATLVYEGVRAAQAYEANRRAPKFSKNPICDAQYKRDIAHCKGLTPGTRAACYSQAMERLVACEAGRSLPPLPF